jgi:hypothetical protein
MAIRSRLDRSMVCYLVKTIENVLTAHICPYSVIANGR